MNELILYQKKDGYRYNSDTNFLYYFIRSFGLSGEVLDVGCGCGILGLLVKRDFEKCSVTLLDIMEQNIKISQKNAKENGLEVNFLNVDYQAYTSEQRYDFIISNPPFYHDGVKKSQNEHIRVSRYSENLPLKNFIKKSYDILKDKGYFYFCYDAQMLPNVLCELKNANFNAQNILFIYPTNKKNASLVVIRARKNAKATCKIEPSIIASDENGYTKKAKEIFELINTKAKDLS